MSKPAICFDGIELVRVMNRNEVIALVKEHEAEIRERGVTGLSLFGSTIRGEAGAGSDVDFLVEINRKQKFSLIDHASLKLFFEKILGCEADMIMRDNLKPFLKDEILLEAIEVIRR